MDLEYFLHEKRKTKQTTKQKTTNYTACKQMVKGSTKVPLNNAQAFF
jgi:hypothetical protein